MAKRRANGTLHEAIMDVDVAFPSVLRLWHIDVSVRSPTSDRYASAQLHPEHALRAAVREKLARYGPGVSPIVLGALGRVETSSTEALCTMAAAAQATCTEPGSSSSRTAAAAPAHCALGTSSHPRTCLRQRGVSSLCQPCP